MPKNAKPPAVTAKLNWPYVYDTLNGILSLKYAGAS